MTLSRSSCTAVCMYTYSWCGVEKMAAYRLNGCCGRKLLLLIFVFGILLICCFQVFRPQFIKPDGISNYFTQKGYYLRNV